MSMLARRAGQQALRTRRVPVQPQLRRTYADSPAPVDERSKDFIKKGAKRDPELYILLTIMSGAFALAGWHFSRNPTSSSSEHHVARVPDSEPWKTGGEGKYQYHPGGDTRRAKRDAPSALNEVVIPNVNLPKSYHEQYNKWGKEL